ncbi:MAG: response regulator [Pseudomonadota bacterium]
MDASSCDPNDARTLAEMIDADPMPCAVYAPEGRLIRCNDAYREMNRIAFAGLPPGLDRNELTYELLMRARAQQMYAADRIDEYVIQRLREHNAASGVGVDREIAGKGWFRIFKYRTPSGAVLTRCVDISELKMREAELEAAQKLAEASTRRLEAALEVMEDGFAIYDSDDRLVMVNSAMKRLHDKIAHELEPGLSYEEGLRLGLRRGMWDIGDADPDEWVASLIRDRKESPTFESVVRFADGRWMRRLEATTPDGERVGIRTDITKMKLREAELRDARERTEQAAKAKSEFLANMSHEIRTPLNGILGMAELLAITELDQKQSQFANTIVKSGHALLTIINDILDFSKIDSGQLELDIQSFEVAEAVEDVAALLSSAAEDKGLELAIRISPEVPPKLNGDVSRIRQILTNMVGNALKFTDKGHVLVDVGGARSGARWNLHIQIEDTGIGIPQDKLDRIFDKFSQVDGSATRRHEGTGLGLSICKLLSECMGGDIGVHSKLGQGSTFWISVPLEVAENAGSVLKMPVDVTGTRVLVVDDNAVNRSILEEQLTAWEFDVSSRPTGWEGLSALTEAAVEGTPYELLILDQQMPHVSGEDVLKIMRSQENISSTNVIMLTSVGQSGDAKHWRKLGASGYLVKPARSQELFQTIVDCLRPVEAETARAAPVVDAVPVPSASGGLALARGGEVTPMSELAELVAGPVKTPTFTSHSFDDVFAEAESEAAPAPAESPESVAPDSAAEEVPEAPAIQPSPPPAHGANLADVAAEVSAAAPSPSPSPSPAPSPGPASGEAEPYILVAEDNDTNQMFMEFVLGDMGYDIKLADDGAIAFDDYKARRPVLIFMDISMPNMDGIETTKSIRAFEAEHNLSPVPIVAVTAHALKGDSDRFLAVGMDDYLSKPVAPSKIAEKLDKWLPSELALSAPRLA